MLVLLPPLVPSPAPVVTGVAAAVPLDLDESEACLRGARGVEGELEVAVGVVTAVPLPALLDDKVLRLEGVVVLVRLLELSEEERLYSNENGN